MLRATRHASNLVMSPGCCGDHRRNYTVVVCSSFLGGKSWFEPGLQTQEWPEAKRPHPHVELGHAVPMPSLERSVSGLLVWFSVVIPVVSLHA